MYGTIMFSQSKIQYLSEIWIYKKHKLKPKQKKATSTKKQVDVFAKKLY